MSLRHGIQGNWNEKGRYCKFSAALGIFAGSVFLISYFLLLIVTLAPHSDHKHVSMQDDGNLISLLTSDQAEEMGVDSELDDHIDSPLNLFLSLNYSLSYIDAGSVIFEVASIDLAPQIFDRIAVNFLNLPPPRTKQYFC